MVVAAVVVVAGGGVTAALALASPTGVPGSINSPAPLVTLTEPGGLAPTSLAFKSDGTLITVDAVKAYSWDIATGRPTQTDFTSAQVLTSTKVTAGDVVNLVPDGQGGHAVEVMSSVTGGIVATLAAPSGTVVNAYALSQDGTEAALADSNGRTYVWKVAS
jgi:hypothetical protein